MVTSYGRLYPFAYTLYDILLLFSDHVPPTAVYILHGIALIVLAAAFALLALHVLRNDTTPWRFATVFFFVAICVFRVYPEFISCYTGVWIVYLFLPVFLLFSCRFMDSEKWSDGIIALISINYTIYCYETVFTIPLAIGMFTLLFCYRKLTPRKRLFNGLLVGSGILFLLLYAVIVLPNANGFYHHYGTSSFIKNAVRMFLANKIYCISSVVLIVRAIEVLLKKKPYTFFDSLLLSSFAYFLGAAVLKLNYTYYYNVGALVGLTAILFIIKDWLKPQWVCLFVFALALFYGRKTPYVIKQYQEGRKTVNKEMTILAKQWDEGQDLYWYEPPYEGSSPSYLDMRETSKIRIEVLLSWIKNRDVFIKGEPSFNGGKGIWFVYLDQEDDIPDTPEDLATNEVVFSASGIIGYLCK